MGSRSDEVEQLRREIDATREDLGESVGALAYKADVKNRGKEALEDKKEVVMQKVDEVKGKLPSTDAMKDKLPDGQGLKDKLPDGAPSKEDIKAKAQDAAETVRQNPAAVAGAAAVAGLAAGLALPETEIERQKVKPAAQDARRQAIERVQETVQQVKSGAQDAAGSVADAVKEQARQQDGKVGELPEKAADKTQDKVRRGA